MRIGTEENCRELMQELDDFFRERCDNPAMAIWVMNNYAAYLCITSSTGPVDQTVNKVCQELRECVEKNLMRVQ